METKIVELSQEWFHKRHRFINSELEVGQHVHLGGWQSNNMTGKQWNAMFVLEKKVKKRVKKKGDRDSNDTIPFYQYLLRSCHYCGHFEKGSDSYLQIRLGPEKTWFAAAGNCFGQKEWIPIPSGIWRCDHPTGSRAGGLKHQSCFPDLGNWSWDPNVWGPYGALTAL